MAAWTCRLRFPCSFSHPALFTLSCSFSLNWNTFSPVSNRAAECGFEFRMLRVDRGRRGQEIIGGTGLTNGLSLVSRTFRLWNLDLGNQLVLVDYLCDLGCNGLGVCLCYRYSRSASRIDCRSDVQPRWHLDPLFGHFCAGQTYRSYFGTSWADRARYRSAICIFLHDAVSINLVRDERTYDCEYSWIGLAVSWSFDFVGGHFVHHLHAGPCAGRSPCLGLLLGCPRLYHLFRSRKAADSA